MRGGDGAAFNPLRVTLLENLKIWCKIQVIIHLFLNKNKLKLTLCIKKIRFFHGPFIQQLEDPFSRPRVIVELKGHPFPPLSYSNNEVNRGLISNVLLAEARREARLREEFNKSQSS